MNIRVDNSDKDRIIFKLYRSPANNNITAKNNRLNLKYKRLYITATILLNNRIESNIKKFIKDNRIALNTAAYVSYIEHSKVQFNPNRSYTYKNSVFINNIYTDAMNITYNKKFYNTYNRGILFTKGYGAKLLKYIEEYLKKSGYKIIFLIPSNARLISYYNKHGYVQNTVNINTENNNINSIKYSDYVPPNLIMYKKL